MGTLRRTLSLLSVVAMLSTLVVSTAFAGTLPPDVTEGDDTSWYTGSLANLVAMGCVDGDADFNPGAYATRAETAQMLACALTENAIPAISEAPAGDVAADDAAAAAISYLMGAGVVSGYTDADGVSTGMFGPADLLTREQVAKMTALGYGLVDGGVSFPFSDSVSDWAGEYVTTSYTWGVVTGYPDGTFGGGNNVLKAEVVAMVERAMDPVHVETGETPAEYSADGGSTDGGETTSEPAGGLTVSAMSMGSQEVPTGATGVVVAAFEFSANDGDAEVSTVTVERSGLGNETDFDKVYLYDEDMVKIGSGKSLNSSDEQAEFTNVGIDVEDGESTTVYVVVDVDTAATEGTHAFSIVEVDAGDSDVTLDGATGDSFETSTITIGAADVESDTDAHTAKVGEDSVEVADFSVHVDSVEDGTFEAVALYLDGDSEIISNPVLERGATEVGSCEVAGEYVVCSGIDYEIENGESATFTLYADVDGEAGDTVDIYIEDKTDVAIMGDSFGYNLTLAEAEGGVGSMIEELDSTPMTDTVTLEAGQLTLAYNGPAAGDVSEDTNNVTLIAFSLSAESDVEIEDAQFAVYDDNGTDGDSDGVLADADAAGQLLTSDLEDLELVCNGTVIGQIGTLEAAATGDDTDDADAANTTLATADTDVLFSNASVQTFEDTWTIDAGETVDCELRVDIENGVNGDMLKAEIMALSTWSIEDDNGDAVTDILPSGNIEGNEMTIQAASLDINVAGGVSGGQTYVKGTEDAEMVAFVFTAGEGEDVTVSSLTFEADADASGALTDVPDGDSTLDPADSITAVSLWSDGSQIDADSLATNNTVTFNGLDWIIEAGTSETLYVAADVSTTISSDVDVAIALTSATGEYGDSGTDLDSALTITSDNTDADILHTFSETGSLTQQAYADTPENALVADGSSDVVMTTVRLDASDEAFTIDKYGIKVSEDADGDDNTDAADIALTEDASGITRVGIMCADADGVVNTYYQVLVDTNASFTGLDCYVEKDETAYMYLMADFGTVESGALANGTSYDLTGDAGDNLTFRATGADSGETISDLTALVAPSTDVDPEGGTGADGFMTVYESYPTFVAGTAADSAIVPSLTQEVAAFTVSAGSEDITFAAGSANIEATLIEDGDTDGDIVCSLVADGDTVDTPAAPSTNGTAIDWDFTDDTVTVPAGGSVEFTVECDTTQLNSEGDLIQIILPETDLSAGLDWDIDGDGGAYDEAAIILDGDITLPALSKA